MKIEIDIDLESIVIEALKKKEIPIGNLLIKDPVVTEAAPSSSRSKWEYGRKNGRRRTPEEMALHDLEREKGRRLTPEEKGETKAKVQLDESAENKAKEDAIKQARIKDLTNEGVEEPAKKTEEEEPEIPEVEPLDNIDSLFH
jgi:hypothetical protein